MEVRPGFASFKNLLTAVSAAIATCADAVYFPGYIAVVQSRENRGKMTE
jgi:hypothetical protein